MNPTGKIDMITTKCN